MPAAKPMKTPGVYIVENNAFPNSIVEVATAVPAFIGHTEKADNRGQSLRGKPFRLSSLSEFETYFGVGPATTFTINEVKDVTKEETDFIVGGKSYNLTLSSLGHNLYNNIRLFFLNGGGPCYVMSVGDYSVAP